MNYKVYNSVIITPLKITTSAGLVDVLDVPFPIRYLNYTDENGNPQVKTFQDLIEQGNDFPISKNGKHRALFLELSDLHNEPATLKQFLVDSGMALGGFKYDPKKEKAVWYLTMSEWNNEFRHDFFGQPEEA